MLWQQGGRFLPRCVAGVVVFFHPGGRFLPFEHSGGGTGVVFFHPSGRFLPGGGRFLHPGGVDHTLSMI